MDESIVWNMEEPFFFLTLLYNKDPRMFVFQLFFFLYHVLQSCWEANHILLPLITEARTEAGRCVSSASFTSRHKKKGPITFGYSPLCYSMHMQKPKPNSKQTKKRIKCSRTQLAETGKRKNDGRLFVNVLNKFKIS